MPDFGKHPDGSPRRFGDLPPDERDAATARVTAKLRAELTDPDSATRKRIAKILEK